MTSVLDLLNSAATALLANVINSLVFAAIIGASIWAFATFARGVNAATRHFILWAALLAVLAIPLTKIALELEATVATPVAKSMTNAVIPFEEPVAAPSPTPSISQPSAHVPSMPDLQFPFELRAGYVPLLFGVIWAAVCLAQLARIGWSYVYLNRLKRESVPASRELRLNFDEWKLACGVDRYVRLLISDEVSSPLAAGFSKPAVIMPRALMENLTPDDLDHVVLHELAHLARRDDWTNLVARLASAFFGLHPVAAWILRRIDAEREIACDDWVVDMIGASKPYAASLARLIEFRLSRRREALATGIGGRRSELASRIERLARASGKFSARTSYLAVNSGVAALALIVFAAAQGPHWIAFAQDDPPPVPPIAPVAPATPVKTNPPVLPASAIAEREVPSIPRVPIVLSAPSAPSISAVPRAYPPPAPAAPAIADVAELPAPVEYAYVPPPPAAPHPVQAAPAAPPPLPPAKKANSSGTSFLASLAQAGYADLSVDEVIELKNNGVSGAYIAAMSKAGWGKLTTKQLIDLHNHGVNPEYLQALSSVGMKNLTLKDTVDLRNHGVRPELIRETYSLGFGPYTVRQIIEFANHGTRPEFFRALKEAGFLQADPREIIEAVNHGMNASDLREAKKYGANLTLRQIIRLKEAGVI